MKNFAVFSRQALAALAAAAITGSMLVASFAAPQNAALAMVLA